MSAESAFTITYWGVTGTLCAPLRPPEVTDKLVRAVEELAEQGGWRSCGPDPACARPSRSRSPNSPFTSAPPTAATRPAWRCGRRTP